MLVLLLFWTANHNGNQSNVVEHYKKYIYVVFGKGVVNSAMSKTVAENRLLNKHWK